MASSEIAFRPSSLNIVYSSLSSNIIKTAMYNVHFKNWSETFECRPKLFFAPKTVNEISAVVELARIEKKKIRVVGCKHSPSDIACTDDIMISLQNFNKIIEIDKTRKLVTVQAGINVNEMNDALYSHNLALKVLGDVSDISIGGAISVATHGTGLDYGTLSSYVTELDIMLSDGGIIKLTPEEDFESFEAAVCSLGSFGIILNVTIQCEEAFNLHMRKYGMSLKDVIENLEVHLTGSDHFQFMWFPYTDCVVASHSTRTDLPAKKESWISKLWTFFWDHLIGYHALELSYYISTFFPHTVPYINRFFYYIFSTYGQKVDKSYRIFNRQSLFKQHVNEWAIPIEKTGTVLWQLREWIESTPGVYVHFPIQVRFVKAEDVFLSPSFGRNSCYINITMYRPYGKSVPSEEYWAAYEHIMLGNGGRPHWATIHSVKADSFKQMYPYFGKWCQIRGKLDPLNMFLNSYMKRIL